MPVYACVSMEIQSQKMPRSFSVSAHRVLAFLGADNNHETGHVYANVSCIPACTVSFLLVHCPRARMNMQRIFFFD